ncbi:MAG: endolytic transglycosylase MltG, partial [Myxococcaceae bacterium]
AGEYEFDGALSPADVARRIIAGEVKVYRFTVPEGLRADEILPIVAASELKLDLEKLTRLVEDPAFLRKAGIPTERVEGFLYQDTYTFTRNANEETVLKKMISRSLEEYEKAAAMGNPPRKLDLIQTFTLASIIEKETGAPEERPRISCVFHNRLRLGMKLQTDPTVLYAASLIRGSWVNNITRRDLETSHPYNTYTTKGLPPGPIASPGAAALQAALNPLQCEDLFFVSRNDGTHIFCPDLKCHEAAVDKWQRAYFRNKRKNG